MWEMGIFRKILSVISNGQHRSPESNERWHRHSLKVGGKCFCPICMLPVLLWDFFVNYNGDSIPCIFCKIHYNGRTYLDYIRMHVSAILGFCILQTKEYNFSSMWMGISLLIKIHFSSLLFMNRSRFLCFGFDRLSHAIQYIVS